MGAEHGDDFIQCSHPMNEKTDVPWLPATHRGWSGALRATQASDRWVYCCPGRSRAEGSSGANTPGQGHPGRKSSLQNRWGAQALHRQEKA